MKFFWTIATLFTLTPTAIALPLPPMATPANSTHAIVRLKNMELPRPTVSGQATLPLHLLPDGKVWTIDLKIGQQSGRFLIDTGAATSMVAPALARQLGLIGTAVPGDRVQYAVAGNGCANLKAILHHLPAIAAQSLRVENLMALELSSAIIPGDLSGVLGMDFLTNFDILFNPSNQQLQLLPPSSLSPPSSSQAVPLKGKLGVMLAELEINGKGPFTFLLDTGAESTFISKQVAQKLAFTPPQMPEISVEGFCGLESAKVAVLDSAKLQNYQLTNLEAIVLDSSVLKVLNVDGILGQNFLNAFEQHWRFEQPASGKFPQRGSLVLHRLTSR